LKNIFANNVPIKVFIFIFQQDARTNVQSAEEVVLLQGTFSACRHRHAFNSRS